MQKVYKNKSSTIDFMLSLFRVIGIVLLMIIISLFIYSIKENNLDLLVKILVPLGVLVSAFLASYSVLKGIEHTKQVKLDEEKKLKKRNSIMLVALLKQLIIEIETQIDYFNQNIATQEKFKYNDQQNQKRFLEIADKITDLEINSFTSADIIQKLITLKTEILDAIHAFTIYSTNSEENTAKNYITALELEEKNKILNI